MDARNGTKPGWSECDSHQGPYVSEEVLLVVLERQPHRENRIDRFDVV